MTRGRPRNRFYGEEIVEDDDNEFTPFEDVSSKTKSKANTSLFQSTPTKTKFHKDETDEKDQKISIKKKLEFDPFDLLKSLALGIAFGFLVDRILVLMALTQVIVMIRIAIAAGLSAAAMARYADKGMTLKLIAVGYLLYFSIVGTSL